MIYFSLEIAKIKPYVINKCCKLKFQEIINFLYETKRFIDNPSFNHRNIYLPYQENAKCQIRQYTIVKMAKLFLHYWKPRRDLKGYCTWKILWFIGIQTLKWKCYRILKHWNKRWVLHAFSALIEENNKSKCAASYRASNILQIK